MKAILPHYGVLQLEEVDEPVLDQTLRPRRGRRRHPHVEGGHTRAKTIVTTSRS